MLRRFIGILSITGLLGLALAVVLAGHYSTIFNRLEITDSFLEIAATALLLFLLILILRYISLLCFSFIEKYRTMKGPVETAAYPSVTLIMPAYNEGLVIESSIRSALSLNYPDYEVIVVDDGSSDDTYEKASAIAAQVGPRKLRVFTQPNGGKATALNTGIRYARGELVLCTDSDSRLDREAVRHMVKHFADPAVTAVAGNVRVVNRRNTLTRLQALEYIEGLNLVRAAQSLFGVMTVIPGPIGMFRKSAVQALGGYLFDTFAEDCDLTLRLMVAGGRIRYEPDAIAFTEAPEHTTALFRQRYRWGRGILQALIKQRQELWRPWNVRLWLTFASLAFESIVLPTINLFGVVLLIITTLGGISSLGLLWWAGLTMLDTSVALYCVAREREQLPLIVQSVAYRLVYVLFVDTIRFFSWVDEMFDVRMSWMRVARHGRI